MIRRLVERVFDYLGIGCGWCGGCDEEGCMECVAAWPRERVGEVEPLEVGDNIVRGVE